jgi:hypothetical protein
MSKEKESPVPGLVEEVMQELILGQRQRVLCLAQRIVPPLTEEDLLQPQDFSELDLNPEFRYEEGILVGFEAAITALRSIFNSARF